MAFSPQADYLAASSWDNQVRIYDIQPSGMAIPKAAYAHDEPALDVAWSRDGTKLISGGADRTGRLFDINTGQSMQIAEHSAPIKCVKFLDQGQTMVVTGSWDKTLKYWDLRTRQPIGSVQLPERCYSMDTQGSLLVVGTADRHIIIVDLNNPTTIFKKTTSPLKWQTRCVSCFTIGNGYAVGSIEGRVGVQYTNDKEIRNNMSFRCHRDDKKNIFSVNAISFHPTYGTFSTSGSDGTVSFWDKDSRQRMKEFKNVNGTVSCTAFNRTGNIFAYAVSYDWTKGYKFANASHPNRIFLHAVRDETVKPPTKKKR
ncbi:unnamed protein product [Absidia cylindrospora]